jgi:putative oxidoreductase
MNAFISLGRWLFPIPFAVFGLFHFMSADAMAQYVVPAYMPAKVIWVYLSGAGLIAGAVSMWIGKMDKLASVLLAVMLLLIILMVHLPGAMAGGDGAQNAISMVLKDLGMMAGCLIYAQTLAKDRAVIG